MRAITVLGFFLASVGFALSPLEQDNVFFDGEVSADNGRVVLSASVAPSRMPAGWYANVEGLDTLTVVLDGQPIATFGKDALPRSRIKGLDLSEYAGLLRPGNNQIELRTSPGRFWLRMWTSDNAWYPSNFHAHTTYSDGRYSVHDLLQLVLAEGARAYAITDHNTLAQCYDTAFHPVGDLNPIRGTEWTSPLGHANILGPEGATWFDSTMAVREMLDEASYRGGTVQINHPCDDELGFGWTRYPVLDSSVDCIEVFNNLTWFPGGPRTNDREALSWWHSLLVAGHTIAATGNSDYHGTIPGEGGPMESQTRVWAPSNHPDTILKYMKFGQGMVLDESDDGRVYIYADTNNNGSWDLVMGQHARVTSSRTIRFRAEVEDADWLDDFWVYNRYGTVHNHWFTNPLGPWDYAYEWTANYNAQSRDFVRAYLENAANDPELATNPIYVNHPDYELGPTRLWSRTVNRPDTVLVSIPETLRFRLTNAVGFSPWRYGIAFACDTARWEIIGWQSSGPGIGQVQHRTSGRYRILEWQGGYTWSNRLSVGTSFDFWLVVRARARGNQQVLFRSWAHDRIQLVELEPGTGFFGPEARVWHCETVFVKAMDVQPVSIDVPAAVMDSSGPIVPQATVRNNGNVSVDFGVVMDIGSGYSGSASVTGLGPGATRQVSFSPAWQPARGEQTIRCITLLAPDCAPENDTLLSSVRVRVHDAAAVAVTSPQSRIPAGRITPVAKVRNRGTEREPVKVFFCINSVPVYAESVELTHGLPVDADTLVAFPDWVAANGSYLARCSTALVQDQQPGNDTVSLHFVVGPTGQTGWQERANLPNSARVGAFLVSDQATMKVYGAPGGKTSDFYAYDPAGDSWSRRCPIPAGVENKPAGKGANACAAGNGTLYVVKGNNTQSFYRYDAARDSWHALALVPLGTSNKRVKGGADIVYADGCVYLVKGDRNEFYSYAPVGDSWTALTPIPAATPRFGAGSFTVYDGNQTIYVHQAKYNDMFAYDITTGAWRQMPSGIPLVGRAGRSRKAKDGSSGAWLGGWLYALKGGNTSEFWRYSAATDSWYEMEEMPLLGSSGSRKKVKAGADLTDYVSGQTEVCYALKGNKTREFWCYTPSPTLYASRFAPDAGTGVLSSTMHEASGMVLVFPNPLRAGFATLKLGEQATQGPVSVSVIDVSGRVVRHSSVMRASSLPLDLRDLRSGVYLLVIEAGRVSASCRLVVGR